MAYKDDMCSNAAIYIGDNPIADVENEEGAAPEALNAVYDQTFNGLLSCYMWSFSTVITELSEPSPWVIDTEYFIGDYVSNDNDNYRCIADHTSISPDVYSASVVEYTVDEYVTYNDIVYICVQINGTDSVVVTPGDDVLYWVAEEFTSVYEPGDGTLTDTYWELSVLSGSEYNHLNYNNEFVLPSSNILKIWAVYPLNSDYKIISDKGVTIPKTLLLSNFSEVSIEHTFPYTGTPPDFFNEAFSWALADKVALSVTEDNGTVAKAEKGLRNTLAIAKNIDSQGKRPVSIVDCPFIQVR
jgi:hypothetical protein